MSLSSVPNRSIAFCKAVILIWRYLQAWILRTHQAIFGICNNLLFNLIFFIYTFWRILGGTRAMICIFLILIWVFLPIVIGHLLIFRDIEILLVVTGKAILEFSIFTWVTALLLESSTRVKSPAWILRECVALILAQVLVGKDIWQAWCPVTNINHRAACSTLPTSVSWLTNIDSSIGVFVPVGHLLLLIFFVCISLFFVSRSGLSCYLILNCRLNRQQVWNTCNASLVLIFQFIFELSLIDATMCSCAHAITSVDRLNRTQSILRTQTQSEHLCLLILGLFLWVQRRFELSNQLLFDALHLFSAHLNLLSQVICNSVFRLRYRCSFGT